MAVEGQQQGDNRNHDQKLNQSERPVFLSHASTSIELKTRIGRGQPDYNIIVTTTC